MHGHLFEKEKKQNVWLKLHVGQPVVLGKKIFKCRLRILSMSLYAISLWRSAYRAFQVIQFEFSSPKGHYAQFG